MGVRLEASCVARARWVWAAVSPHQAHRPVLSHVLKPDTDFRPRLNRDTIAAWGGGGMGRRRGLKIL
jgi:hypothetical protein